MRDDGQLAHDGARRTPTNARARFAGKFRAAAHTAATSGLSRVRLLRALASSQSASISASVASAGASCRAPPARASIAAKRRSNFALVRAQRRLRIDIEVAREVDDGEQQIADLVRRPASLSPASRARLRSRRPPRGSSRAPPADRSSRSRPCRPCACSFRARVSAGRPAGTPASAPSAGAAALPACARAAFSSALICSHSPLTASGVEPALVAEHMRMPADQLFGDRLRPHRRNRTRLAPRPCGRGRRPAAADRPARRAGRRDRRARSRRRPRRLPRSCRARWSRNSARGPRGSRCRACAAPP